MQTQRRVNGIVCSVNDVVRDARMIWICVGKIFENRKRAHVDRNFAAVVACAHQRESVKRGSIHIGGIFLVNNRHRLRIQIVAIVFCAIAIENFYSVKIIAFALGACFCGARLGSCGETIQRGAGGGLILLIPERMRVRHGFAPIGHREIGVGLLRLAEFRCCVVVFEIVELGEPAKKTGLRGGGAGIGEMDFADIAVRRGLGIHGKCESESEKKSERFEAHGEDSRLGGEGSQREELGVLGG